MITSIIVAFVTGAIGFGVWWLKQKISASPSSGQQAATTETAIDTPDDDTAIQRLHDGNG